MSYRASLVMPGFNFSSIDRGCPIPGVRGEVKVSSISACWSASDRFYLTSTGSHHGNISIVDSCGGELPGHGRDWLLESGEHLGRS